VRCALCGVLVVLASLACALPAAVPPPAAAGQPSPIVWMTNTPTQPAGQTTVEATPTPTENPPTVTPVPTVTLPPEAVNTAPYLYYAQAGDTLSALAVRFSVLPEEIVSPDNPIPENGLIDPGQLLVIPRRLYNTTAATRLLPDSEVVYSPSAMDFDIEKYVQEAGGYLSTYSEYLAATGQTSGAQVVARVAIENSINPRLLLALLEYQSGWVFGQPGSQAKIDYPMGNVDGTKKGLYKQLMWAIDQLSIGYYGWREGLLTDILFSDGVSARLAPDLNAGTVAIQYFFAQLYSSAEWVQATNPDTGFPALHTTMFGDPWARAASVEPLYPPTLTQPQLILPFAVDQIWSYTGGPHGAWAREGARAALDFAPGSVEQGCAPSDNWVVAPAPGLVVRTAKGILALDLDGDGREQTGWVIVYLHIATENKIPVGTWVVTGQFLGNPSCEGGFSTGTHVHMARKYNGEWIPADGPIPFVLSGWRARAGAKPYEGALERDGVIIQANQYGTFETRISRKENDP